MSDTVKIMVCTLSDTSKIWILCYHLPHSPSRIFSILHELQEIDTTLHGYMHCAGVLEANFVEPAHDKQSFERTAVLSRLELRLLQMQKIYWC